MIPRPSPTQASFKLYVVPDFKRICGEIPTHHFRQASAPLAGKGDCVNGGPPARIWRETETRRDFARQPPFWGFRTCHGNSSTLNN